MNVVIFDPEDFEPITIIQLDRGWFKKLAAGEVSLILRFPICEPVKISMSASAPNYRDMVSKIAEIRFEKFRYLDKVTWMAFALNPELCLLLKSVFLPGQQRDVKDIEARAIAKGFMDGLQMATRLRE